jgi:hypothetical protein
LTKREPPIPPRFRKAAQAVTEARDGSEDENDIWLGAVAQRLLEIGRMIAGVKRRRRRA